MFLPKLISKSRRFFLVFAIMQFFLPKIAVSQLSVDKDEKEILKLAEDFMLQSKYDSAIVYFTILAEEASQIENWQAQIQYSLRLIEAYRTMDMFRETDSCLSILESNSNYNLDQFPIEKAEFLHQKGTSMGDQGYYSKAIDYLKQVLQIRMKINGSQDTLMAKTYNNMGTYYFYMGDLKKASNYYENALSLAMKTQSQKSNIASFMQNIGIIYARMGDFETALKYFNDNLKINSEVLSPDDPDIAQIYLNLGQLYSLLSRYEEALKYNNLAEQIYIKKFGKEYVSLGTLYLNRSRIYGQLSDPEETEKYLKNALNIYNIYLKPDHPNIARIYNNLGSISLLKKNYSQAKEYFLKSLNIQKDVISQLILLRNLGGVDDKLKNYSEAEKYYKLSIAKSQKELGIEHYEYGNSLEEYSKFLMDHGRMKEAESLIQKAINNHLLNYSDRNANLSEAYILYGQYLYKSEDYLSALNYFQKSMIADDFIFSDTNIYINAGMDNVISEPSMLLILISKAEAFSKLYNQDKSQEKYLDAGLKCYQDVMPLYEKLRSKLKYESKLVLMEQTSKRFDLAYEDYFDKLEMGVDEKFLNAAFEFIEKNKAAVLLSSMKNLDAIKFGGIPEAYQLLEKQIKERINGYENLIYNEKQIRKPDSSKIVLWEKRLFDISNQYDSLINVFGKNYPAYYDLKYDHAVMNLSEVQGKINENQVIVEYTLTDSLLFTFLITSDNSIFKKTKLNAEFYSNLSKLLNVSEINMATHSLEDFHTFVTASNLVYQSLFGNIEDEIKGKKLIIIPDGKLGYLSFESLVTTLPDMKSINYRNLDYLIRKTPISYSYSSTLLFKNIIPQSSGNSVLAFAPSYISDNSYVGGQSTLRDMASQLKPLLNAQEEVSNVLDIFHGKVFKNAEATESNFKLNSPKYDVLHLAMHTLMDDEDPMYSKMVFTLNNDTVNDGYLNTFEIYDLNLKAQLAVLSACNTGSGKILNGEGIMSLARGFIYSGVPSIVMTLWEVDDKSGADIMTRFYTHLKEGVSKDVALQQAKIEYLNSASQLRAHPYFWSAYVNIGNSNPLSFKLTLNYLVYAVGVIILGVFILIYFKRKNKLP